MAKDNDRIAIGDPHNFGQQVAFVGNQWVHKPRTLFWEQLLLDADSSFRSGIGKLFQKLGTRSPFSSFPALSFHSPALTNQGMVERIQLLGVDGFNSEELEDIGRAVGILLFLGVGDLHTHNVVVGRSTQNKQLIFGPIDIESILEDIEILSQTLLVPPPELTKAACGLHQVLAILDSQKNKQDMIISIVYGFLESLFILQAAEQEVQELLAHEVLKSNPYIRIIPRSTQFYQQARENFTIHADPPLAKSEIEQLKRGDIPYYIRWPNDPTIYYMSEPGKFSIADINVVWPKFNRSSPRLLLSGVLSPRQSSNRFLKTAPLQLARFLSDGLKAFRSSHRGLVIEVTEKVISIRYHQILNVECER